MLHILYVNFKIWAILIQKVEFTGHSVEPNKDFYYKIKIALTKKFSTQPQYKSAAFIFRVLLSKFTCRYKKVCFKRYYISLPNLVF